MGKSRTGRIARDVSRLNLKHLRLINIKVACRVYSCKLRKLAITTRLSFFGVYAVFKTK